MRVLRLIVLLLSLGLGAVAAAQDAVTLTPFTDETFGIQGMKPEGWRAVAPGVSARGAGAGDATTLVQQAASGPIDALLTVLLPQLGLDDLPESVGTIQTGAFTWDLYTISVASGGQSIIVDLALAESGGRTYIVLLQSLSDDHESLYDEVFIPSLDALAPLSAAPDLALPYTAEEVTFDNGNISLAGTLTLPEGAGPHPALVLITGSGSQDRDESLAPFAGMKPFALIADYLTRQGIAVLRYDDRGVGGSTGTPTAFTADIAADTAAALDYLLSREDINPTQIGILGHSQGGEAAAILGASRPEVAFIIGMAAPAVSGYEFLAAQNQRLRQLAGDSEAAIADYMALYHAFLDAVLGDDEARLEAALYDLVVVQLQNLPPEQTAGMDDLEATAAALVEQQLPAMRDGALRALIESNAGDSWAQTTAPVLGLFGGLDSQVIAEQNAPALAAALDQAGNTDYEIITFEAANHLFQEAETGALSEYAALEQDFLPDFLPTIAEWILSRVDVAGG